MQQLIKTTYISYICKTKVNFKQKHSQVLVAIYAIQPRNGPGLFYRLHGLYRAAVWILLCLAPIVEFERRNLSAEIVWLRRLLCVTRRDRIRNDTIQSMLQQEESLFQKITERKQRVTWFGHVTRMEGEWLPPRALHCHLEGKRSQDR